MAAIVQVPINVSAITLGDGAHSPAVNGTNQNVLTDTSDADSSIILLPYNQPEVVSTQGTNLQISMPPNVTSITVNGNVLTPDGTRLNTITGNMTDLTIVIEQGFREYDELT